MVLHTITIELTAEPDGDLITRTTISGDAPLITALGMLEMARQDIDRGCFEEDE